jgi:hypothetical protein
MKVQSAMKQIIFLFLFVVVMFVAFAAILPSCVRMIRRWLQWAYGWTPSIVVLLLALYWLSGILYLKICGIDACLQFSDHSMREWLADFFMPAGAAVLISSIILPLSFALTGAALAVVAAVIYVGASHIFHWGKRQS